MNNDDTLEALEALYPGSGASIADGRISWERPEPVPDEAAIQAAIAALAERRRLRALRIAARRQRLRDLAQATVGKDAAQLTATDLRALIALLLLERFNVLDDNGVVRPLSEWT